MCFLKQQECIFEIINSQSWKSNQISTAEDCCKTVFKQCRLPLLTLASILYAQRMTDLQGPKTVLLAYSLMPIGQWTTNGTEQVQYFHFWQLSILSTFKVNPL